MLSSLQGIVNPKPFLFDLVGKPVVVKLKWGMEYHGEWRGREEVRWAVWPLTFLAPSPFTTGARSPLSPHLQALSSQQTLT